MLLPMLGACFVAMLIPMPLRDPPIYDSLREHTLRLEREINRTKRVRQSQCTSSNRSGEGTQQQHAFWGCILRQTKLQERSATSVLEATTFVRFPGLMRDQ